MPVGRPARAVVVAVVAIVVASALASGCGDDDSGGGTGSTTESTGEVVTSLPSTTAWCATYQESLPALASPNPDGRELEVLDLYVARYRLLAAGAPEVPASAVDAADRLAAAYATIRQRVADGEELPAVLQEEFADDNSELIVAGSAFDEEAGRVCP